MADHIATSLLKAIIKKAKLFMVLVLILGSLSKKTARI